MAMHACHCKFFHQFCVRECIQQELYQGFNVPELLAGADCPHEVFSFLEQDVPLPTEVAQTLAAMQAGQQD